MTGFHAALHTVAAAAFIFLAFTGYHHLGYALTLVGLLGVAARGAGAGPAATAPALAILTAGVLADLPAGWTAAYAGGTVLLLVTAQAALANVGRVPRLRAFNVSGLGQQRRPMAPGEVIATVAMTLVAVLVSFGYGSWPLWPLAIVATAALVAVVAVVGYSRVQLARMTPERARLDATLDRLGPEFIAYFAGERGEEHQLVDWLPHLERVGKPFLVVTRDIGAARLLARHTAAPVLHCPTVPTVDAAIQPSVRAVFYVNNANLNSHIARFSKLVHIQLLHGDSDKPASYHPVTAIFDRVFVAGPGAIMRYADHGVVIASSKFDVVGRPQAAGVEPARRRGGNIVLYTPTLPGRYADEDFCSLRVGERIMSALLDAGAVVILRAHPSMPPRSREAAVLRRLQGMLRADRRRTGRPHVFGSSAAKMTLIEAMNASDALISDVSAVAVDYLTSGKPYALTDMRSDAASRISISPLTRAAHLIAADGRDCDKAVASLLAGGGPDDEKQPLRLAARDYYLAPDTFVATAARRLAGPAAEPSSAPAGSAAER